MFVISVENIKIEAFIGVYEEEKIHANFFSIDVYLETDYPQAMLTDNVEDALDYGHVYEIVVQQMQIPCNLLEKKAYQIAKDLFVAFIEAHTLRLKIRKYAPLNMPLCEYAAIEYRIERVAFLLLYGNLDTNSA